MKRSSLEIRALWELLSSRFPVEEAGSADNPNSLVRPPRGSVQVRSRGADGGYSDIVCLSRHFVRKPMYTVRAKRLSDGESMLLCTTNDHTCARIEGGGVVFAAAKELRAGDLLPVVDDGGVERSAEVESVVEDPNEHGQWVYDLEVASGSHVYYANGVLVHNSQFINLSPVTRTKCREAGIDESTRFSELPETVRKAVIDDAYRIMELVNANVERLINENCHTTQGGVLRYALEYVASEGFYFKKKHYIVHKVISDDIPCDKFKYSGISVKKAEIPASMKTFLKDIYERTMTSRWSESDYVAAVNEAYRRFITLDWEDMSFYRKLRTPKAATGLTTSEKGAGAHAKAANIYNGLIEELGLGGKYPVIGVGDEMRYSYVLPNNPYGIEVLGFKGTFPEEFRSMFRQDYNKMFDKIFTKSLENYVEIMKYAKFDPTKSVEDASFDIF